MRITNRQDLARYLDYCSEMLSITGKLAALFAQSVNDEVVVGAVNDIEELGSNLSRKIWQKITMIEGQRRDHGAKLAAALVQHACRRRLVTSARFRLSRRHEPSYRSRRKSRSPHPLPLGHAGRRRRAVGAGERC